MNITKSLFALLLTGAVFTGCNDSANEPKETASKTEVPAGKLQTARFNIEGMTCAMGCAKTIESKLAKLDGVKSASVDFEKKSATVEFDSAKQTPEKIAETVEAVAGGDTYKVTNLKSSGDQAMVVNKEKKKNKKKDDKKADDKKEGCATDAKAKPGCCSAKKSCHSEKAAM